MFLLKDLQEEHEPPEGLHSNRTNTKLQRKEKQQFSCEGLQPGENPHPGPHVKLEEAMEVLERKRAAGQHG